MIAKWSYSVATILFVVLTFSAHLISSEESQVTTVNYRTLQKVVTNFPAVLVKFDEQYPVNSNEDTQYKQLAQDLQFSNNVLVVEVKVPPRSSVDSKEEDISEERRLAEKFNVADTANLPAVFLFKQGQFDNPVQYDKKVNKFDSNSIRDFVRANAPNVRLLLESCIESLDELAEKFMQANNSEKDRKAILKNVHKQLDKLSDDEKLIGQVYVKLMERTIERGDMFLQSEQQRIKNLLNGQVSETKKKQLQNRLNILDSFRSSNPTGKEEL